jgi:two-component system chemotaxis response regulator CheY
MNVLIVMGSPEERSALAGQLAELGIESLEASGAPDAIATLQRVRDVAAVLSGWQLAREHGLDLLRTLRADARWQGLPVVMVTGADELGQVTQALDAGASEYLMKPHDAQDLLEKLLLVGVDPERQQAA